VTNDELRQTLAKMPEHQIKEIVFNHYAPVAERVVPTAGRDPYTMALLDYVDRFGDAERVRLADIIAMYNPGFTPSAAFQKANGKQIAPNTMPYSSENLPPTVAKLEAQVSMMARTLDENQQRLGRISDALAPMAKFDIEDWIRVKDTLETVQKTIGTVQETIESLAQQGRLLLAWFVAGTILTLIVLCLLVALVMRHVV